MATIATDQDVVTLVNVFTVSEERQRLPGYVSANIHRSLDGTKVVNYAQWRRVGDFEAMLRDPTAQEHMRSASQLATSVEPQLYEVAFTDQAGEERRP